MPPSHWAQWACGKQWCTPVIAAHKCACGHVCRPSSSSHIWQGLPPHVYKAAAAAAVQLGYYGFREQQALRAALLARQQELEQSKSQILACAPTSTCRLQPSGSILVYTKACISASISARTTAAMPCQCAMSACRTGWQPVLQADSFGKASTPGWQQTTSLAEPELESLAVWLARQVWRLYQKLWVLHVSAISMHVELLACSNSHGSRY